MRRATLLLATLLASALSSVVPSPAGAQAAADAAVLAFGTAPSLGAPPVAALRSPLVGMSASPAGAGYWLVAADGGVFAYGAAPFLGSTGDLALRRPVVGMAAARPQAAGQPGGYWLVAADGGVFAFGAPFLGSTGGLALVSPVVGMAVTPTGAGYWLVAGDGGVFAFGDAPFLGSLGATRLNRPVVAMAATPTGAGYWLVAADGGVFAFGDAAHLGSAAGVRLARPVTAVAPTATGKGYWLMAADGGVFAFGDAVFLGSGTGRLPAGTQVVGAAAGPGGYWMAAGRPVPARGAVGPGVAALQQRLLDLGFWGPVDGTYGPLTVQQVYAFQKANGLPRDGQLGAEELPLLEQAGRVQPRSTAGYVVEVDKARQLLVVARDGYAEWVFNTSTGNNRPYGPGAVAVTPEGRFRFYNQINGLRISALGQLFRPKYFVGGYAVHGSPSVPPFPASHGCVRVTNAAIDFIWSHNLIPMGTEVWVYS